MSGARVLAESKQGKVVGTDASFTPGIQKIFMFNIPKYIHIETPSPSKRLADFVCALVQ